MAPPVYSTRFIAAQLGDASSASYAVPDGFIAVVRDISGVIIPGPNSGTNFQVAVANIDIFNLEAPPSCSRTIHWEGRVVANAGDSIRAFNQYGVGFTEVYVTVSGYLLTAP